MCRYSPHVRHLLLLPLLAATGALAFEKNHPSVEEIIIVAAQSHSSPLELPYSVSRIDKQQMQREQPRNTVEALSKLPGVMVQKTANGQGSPFVRGFTGYRTLAMIDGVRYNNSVYRDGPNQYFSLIDSFTLDNIELLSGPASTLYGSDAIGGTLNLQTKTAINNQFEYGQQHISGKQQYRYASAERSHSGRTEFNAGAAQKWGLLTGISYKNFGDVDAAEIGKQPKTGYQERAGDFRFDQQINEQWELTLLHQSLKQDDVWRTHSTHYAKSFSGTTMGDDQLRLKNQRRSLSYVTLQGNDLNFLADQVKLTISQQRWQEDGERIKENGEQISEYFDSRMDGINLLLGTQTQAVNWSYGVDFYRDNVDSGRTDYNADGSLDQIRIQGPVGDDSRYDVMGLYIQAEIFASEKLSLLVGSRFTRTKASVGAYEDPFSGDAASFANSWNSTVSSIRASYSLDQQQQWKLWAGLSQSFRAPNIADLSRYGKSRSDEFEIAATGLKPEKFLTYEVGIKGTGSHHQFSASYYYTDIKDFISSTLTGRVVDGLTEVSKQNSANGYIQGIELSGEYSLNNHWTLFSNLTWLEGRLDVFKANTNTTVMESFSRMMPLTAHIGLEWTNPANDWWLRTTVTRAEKADKLSSADQQDTQRIPPGGTPAWTLINISMGKTISENFDITIKLENVLDEAYRNHGSGSNEPGRGLVAGLSFGF